MTITSPKTNGKYSPEDYDNFAPTGPGTLAGDYLRSFWQPVYHSDDLLSGRAKPIKIMNQEYTLYRGTNGEPHLVDFRCAHRGMQLSPGWVEGDTIRCFYHGWVYDGSGQCVEQPAESQPFCDKIRIGGYPVQDYLGLVFAYLSAPIGEGTPPEFPRYPDFESSRGCSKSTATPVAATTSSTWKMAATWPMWGSCTVAWKAPSTALPRGSISRRKSRSGASR